MDILQVIAKLVLQDTMLRLVQCIAILDAGKDITLKRAGQLVKYVLRVLMLEQIMKVLVRLVRLVAIRLLARHGVIVALGARVQI